MKRIFQTWLVGMLVFVISTFAARGQKIEISPHFYSLLDSAGLEFFEPLEAGYRDLQPLPNPFQDYQFAMRSGKEKLEIRYFIMPWDENKPESTLPNVESFRTVTSVASNAQDALISAIQPEPQKILEDFNADWGMIYFFQPKEEFANWPFCRLVVLHKKEKGTAMVFYLFDNPGNSALDTRYLALRFL